MSGRALGHSLWGKHVVSKLHKAAQATAHGLPLEATVLLRTRHSNAQRGCGLVAGGHSVAADWSLEATVWLRTHHSNAQRCCRLVAGGHSVVADWSLAGGHSVVADWSLAGGHSVVADWSLEATVLLRTGRWRPQCCCGLVAGGHSVVADRSLEATALLRKPQHSCWVLGRHGIVVYLLLEDTA